MAQHTDGIKSFFETFRVASQPVMSFLKPVETHGNCPDTCIHQRMKPPLIKQQAVSNYPPRKTSFIKRFPGNFQVIPQQWLSPGNYNHGIVRINNGNDLLNSPDEIRNGHIFYSGIFFTITATMPAGKVAAQSAFPKDIIQRMNFSCIPPEAGMEFQRKLFPESNIRNTHFLGFSATLSVFWVSPWSQLPLPPVNTGSLNSTTVSSV